MRLFKKVEITYCDLYTTDILFFLLYNSTEVFGRFFMYTIYINLIPQPNFRKGFACSVNSVGPHACFCLCDAQK